MVRKCSKCKKEKDIEDFHKRASLKSSWCKDCRHQYYEMHKDTCLQKAKEWYKQNKKKHSETARKSHLMRKFGMTVDQYNEIFLKQNSKCYICHVNKPGGNGYWHLDHNHITNQVRKILCHNCNMLVGHSKENVAILHKTILYLQEHQCE